MLLSLSFVLVLFKYHLVQLLKKLGGQPKSVAACVQVFAYRLRPCHALGVTLSCAWRDPDTRILLEFTRVASKDDWRIVKCTDQCD